MSWAVPCQKPGHFQMPLAFLCQFPACGTAQIGVSCINCCQKEHHNHKACIVSIAELMEQARSQPKTPFEAIGGLIKGITSSTNRFDLMAAVYELANFLPSPRYQELPDEQTAQLAESVQLFYSNKPSYFDEPTFGKSNRKTGITNFISPMLAFVAGPNIDLVSPYQVVNKQKEITTAFMSPILNRFNESVQAKFKLTRLTPNWIGVGVSCCSALDYSEESKTHITYLSNGWLNARGTLTEAGASLKTGDQVTLKWDKTRRLIIFKTPYTEFIVPLEPAWNEQVHLFVCLYYQSDSVSVIS